MMMTCINPTRTLTLKKSYYVLGVGKKYRWLKNDHGCLIRVRASRFTAVEYDKNKKKKAQKRSNKWEVHVNGCDEKGQASIITVVNKFKEQLHKGEITEDKYGDIINLIADTLQFGEMYEYPDADERKIYEELGIAHLIDEADAMEISVIKKDNKHGHESYGWGGGDKIILFNVSENGDNSIDVDGLEDALKVANLLCDAMNKEGI